MIYPFFSVCVQFPLTFRGVVHGSKGEYFLAIGTATQHCNPVRAQTNWGFMSLQQHTPYSHSLAVSSLYQTFYLFAFLFKCACTWEGLHRTILLGRKRGAGSMINGNIIFKTMAILRGEGGNIACWCIVCLMSHPACL